MADSRRGRPGPGHLRARRARRRLSLGVSVVATAGALLLGAIIGAFAGFHGGRLDDLLMRLADFVLVLPAIYIVIVLRAAMPLVLTTPQVFWTMAGILSLAGWPYPARGVRAVVAAERGKEYAEAARALGASPLRILLRHLLPAARGYLIVQATLLLPAFILAEATLSFVGFGFAEPTPSWGVMLHEAAQAGVLAEAPWLLAPAGAIVISVLALLLSVGHETGGPQPARVVKSFVISTLILTTRLRFGAFPVLILHTPIAAISTWFSILKQIPPVGVP